MFSRPTTNKLTPDNPVDDIVRRCEPCAFGRLTNIEDQTNTRPIMRTKLYTSDAVIMISAAVEDPSQVSAAASNSRKWAYSLMIATDTAVATPPTVIEPGWQLSLIWSVRSNLQNAVMAKKLMIAGKTLDLLMIFRRHAMKSCTGSETITCG